MEKKFMFRCAENFLPDYMCETDNLMGINDHYHKYVVAKDNLAIGNDKWIQIIHIADFLLKESW